MSILPLVIAPDPRLLEVSSPVDVVDDSVRKLIDDMFDTMYYEHGIGLSAVQVGVMKRVIIADVEYTESPQNDFRKNGQEVVPGVRYSMINPEIVKSSEGVSGFEEGCLSFPDERVCVTRPEEVVVSYLDCNGECKELSASGLLATCLQHEIDHINGVVISYHLSPMRRKMMLKRLEKRKKLAVL